ncbi:Alpha-crystallin A chain [Halotydeus destructor]|nr:Alpha-crystallin A chain [Halotydeus destructor]
MVKNDKDKFEVNLDVKQFKPEEIEVKHSDDHFLTIHGKHEERSDEHGLVSREFTRRYKLPKDVEPERMSCMWNQDGTMTIDAPRKPQQPDIESHERKIPIKMADERQRIDQHEAKGEPTFVKSAEQHEEERKQSAEPKEEEMEPEIVDMIKDVEAENEKDKEDKRKFEKPEIEKSDFVKDPQESTAPEREQVTG